LNFPERELSEPVALVELAAGGGEGFCFLGREKIGGTNYAVLSGVFDNEAMKCRGVSKGSIKSL